MELGWSRIEGEFFWGGESRKIECLLQRAEGRSKLNWGKVEKKDICSNRQKEEASWIGAKR